MLQFTMLREDQRSLDESMYLILGLSIRAHVQSVHKRWSEEAMKQALYAVREGLSVWEAANQFLVLS